MAGTKAIVNDNSSPLLISQPRERVAISIVGVKGPPGQDGDIASADKHYEHTQGVAATTWSVAHNLDKFPAVTVVTSAGDVVEGDVNYVDNNNLTVTFIAAFAGRAFCN